MNSDTRSAWALSARLNVLMLFAILLPAVAVLALGGWFVTQVGRAASDVPDTTLPWVVTLAAAMVTVLVVAVLILRLRASVRNTVLELAEVCRQVSLGNRGVRAAVVGEDEFAILANSVNSLLDGTPVRGTARPTEGTEAAALQAQIEKLLQEVSAVGDGDLRVQAEVTPDTLGVLADSFNYMIEELAKVVGRVQATALQVTNATRRLLDRSAEVAQASDAQAMQINSTSDSVARLADFVQLSATNALTAAEAAREALRNSRSGEQAVVETIQGMGHIRENVQETSKKIKRLGERSQEVSEIVRLIEDIADQTNLLALNAAIQSAMAGEHGRGFAVVADEIRALAERVSEATKKIATLVKSIQGDTYEAVVAMEESTSEVVKGSQLADDAGRALQSISASVDRQAQIVENIAAAAGERKQIAEAVAHSMSQIAEIARQTNAATQDATISVSYLAELAEQLRASVATFRLPEQIAEAAGIPTVSESQYAPVLPMGSMAGMGGMGGMDGYEAQPWVGGTVSSVTAYPELPALPAAPMGAAAGGAMSPGSLGMGAAMGSTMSPMSPMSGLDLNGFGGFDSQGGAQGGAVGYPGGAMGGPTSSLGYPDFGAQPEPGWRPGTSGFPPDGFNG